MTIVLVSLNPDDWMRWKDLRLSALSEAPYAFGSLLSDWQDAKEQSWRDRLTNVPFNLIAEFENRDAGMVSAITNDDEVELISLWVAPFARGHGVGDALIGAIIKWATSQTQSRLVLRVAEGNERAEALYARHGFANEQSSEVANRDGVRECLMVRASS